MPELIVFSALVIVIATYIWFSMRDGSWFNALTPQLFFAIPALYIAQLARLGFKLDEPAGVGAWLYVFACYCVPLVIYAVALQRVRVPPAWQVRHRRHLEIQASPWVLLALGVLLYLPVAIEFRADLLNPRSIYEQTRTGYGVNFFLSTMLTTLGFVLYLFKSRSLLRRCLFFVICAGLSLAHGSKGLAIVLGMMWLIHWRYADMRRVPLRQAALLMSLMCVSLIGLFWLLSSGVELNQLANFIVGYSDFTSNGLMIVNDDKPPLLGRLFLEDNLYSRIPRALFANKPKDFGSFYLAKLYFPDSFELDQGVPAFGVGVPFADFSWLTLPILCFGSALLGVLTRRYQQALARFRQPGDFIVFAFLCGVPLFSVGVGYLLPEHLLIAALVTLALGVRVHWGRAIGVRGRSRPSRAATDSEDI